MDVRERTVIELPAAIRDQVVELSVAELPNEACGLLAGNGRIEYFYPMTNADRSSTTYRLDPREQIKVFNEIEDRGWELSGIFHSHTPTEAYPSPTDQAQAFYPDAYYVLVSLADRERAGIRAVTIRDGDIAEQGVRVEP